jgi:hypothetical protein
MAGFKHSGLTSERDYVNQGNLTVLPVALLVLGGVGSACGALGGLARKHLAERRTGAALRQAPRRFASTTQTQVGEPPGLAASIGRIAGRSSQEAPAWRSGPL